MMRNAMRGNLTENDYGVHRKKSLSSGMQNLHGKLDHCVAINTSRFDGAYDEILILGFPSWLQQ